jgi:hypothetical protein
MAWAENNGVRKAILAEAQKKFSEKEDFALPLGLSQMEWEGLTPAEKQKIKECN